jgi:hypothetical protein
MASSRPERLSWEYGDGPETGEEVPIASPPRDEEAPGTPAPPPEQSSDRRAAQRGGGEEEREVRAEDPGLSPEANRR